MFYFSVSYRPIVSWNLYMTNNVNCVPIGTGECGEIAAAALGLYALDRSQAPTKPNVRQEYHFDGDIRSGLR